MRKIFFVMAVVFGSQLANSQDLTFYGLLPAWNQTGKINHHFNYNLFLSTTVDAFDTKIAGVDYPSKDLQVYVQPSFIYVHSPNFNFAVAYVYQRNNPLNDNYVDENRLWQQIIFSFPLGRGRLANRFRFEERFIEDRTTGEYPMPTRFRYQVGFNTRLQGRTLEKGEFYLNAYNEFYFSLSGNKYATYSENWTYAGIGFHLGNAGKIELGYLLQASVRNLQQDKRFLDLAQIMWVTNFNFFKVK
jgi:hypothetical protein